MTSKGWEGTFSKQLEETKRIILGVWGLEGIGWNGKGGERGDEGKCRTYKTNKIRKGISRTGVTEDGFKTGRVFKFRKDSEQERCEQDSIFLERKEI